MGEIYINHAAVAVCAVLYLVTGGLWYSVLFASPWMKANGFTAEDMKKAKPALSLGGGFILAYMMSYNLAFFLGGPETNWQFGTLAGFLAGFGWAAAIFTSIALFEMRSARYILINASFIIVYFTAIGFILGIWR